MMDIERIGFWQEISQEEQPKPSIKEENNTLDDAIKIVAEVYKKSCNENCGKS